MKSAPLADAGGAHETWFSSTCVKMGNLSDIYL